MYCRRCVKIEQEIINNDNLKLASNFSAIFEVLFLERLTFRSHCPRVLRFTLRSKLYYWVDDYLHLMPWMKLFIYFKLLSVVLTYWGPPQVAV